MRRRWKQPPGVWPEQLTLPAQAGREAGMGQDRMDGMGLECVCLGVVSSLQHESRASVQ